MDAKEWYKSKTFWFNAITFGFLVATQVWSDLTPDPNIPVAAGAVAVVINILLRLFATKEPLKL